MIQSCTTRQFFQLAFIQYARFFFSLTINRCSPCFPCIDLDLKPNSCQRWKKNDGYRWTEDWHWQSHCRYYVCARDRMWQRSNYNMPVPVQTTLLSLWKVENIRKMRAPLAEIEDVFMYLVKSVNFSTSEIAFLLSFDHSTSLAPRWEVQKLK